MLLKKLSICKYGLLIALVGCNKPSSTTPSGGEAQQQASTQTTPQVFLVSPREYNLNDLNTDNQGDPKKPNLTVDDAKQLAYTFNGIFKSIYVNNDFILKNKNIQSDISRFTSEALESQNRKKFMLSAVKVFNELGDLHTGLNFGYPYNCFISGFPLKVQRIYDPILQQYNFVVSEKGNLDAIINASYADANSAQYYSKINFQKLRENFAAIHIGDKLYSIKGLAVKPNDPDENDLGNSNKKYFFGAENADIDVIQRLSEFSRTHKTNEGATLARASDLVFSRFGGNMQIPGSNNIEDSFVLTTNNGSYEFPWFSVLSNDPLNDSNQTCGNMVDKTYNNLATTTNPQVYIQASADYPHETFFNALPPINNSPIDTSTFSTRIISDGSNNFAYIKIKEFLPGSIIDPDYQNARKQILTSISTMKDFISAADKNLNIKGVVFDVRDNPGGYGSYATLLGKLFKNNVSDISFAPIISQENFEMYNNLQLNLASIAPGMKDFDNLFIQTSLNQAKDSLSSYKSNDNQLAFNNNLAVLKGGFDSDPNDSSDAILNALKTDTTLQNFVHLFDVSPFSAGVNKPVAVLINGSTFSSGDIFTSVFKDNKIARIYGEDTQSSGGGGANVIFYNQFQSQKNTSIVPLFNSGGLVSGQTAPPLPNDMLLSFAWNRVIRINCELNKDCSNPQSPTDFIEKYYLKTSLVNENVNGVTISNNSYLQKSLGDITESDIQNQPIFKKIMEDME